MNKNRGHITKQRILDIAEELFSEKGFDATSISMIADGSGVNKATIYYHFEDKNEIVLSLLKSIIRDVENHISENEPENISHKEKIKAEIKFMESKKNILKVMLMESLKGETGNNILFECASMIFENDLNIDSREKRLKLMHEFFTGFMPMVSFVVLRDKWCDYFYCSYEESLDLFLEVFESSHLNSHFL